MTAPGNWLAVVPLAGRDWAAPTATPVGFSVPTADKPINSGDLACVSAWQCLQVAKGRSST